MTNTKLSSKSATRLFINLICNKLFILAPLYFKQCSGGAALTVTTLVFACSFILWNLYCKHCTASITNYINIRFLKYCFVSLIVVIITLITSATIRQYSISLKSSVLKETPFWIITTFFIISTISGYGCSLKSIGYAGILFVPIIYVVALILVLLSVKNQNIYNFFPIIDTQNNEVLKNIIVMFSMQFELILLYFLPDLLDNPEHTQKTGNTTIFCSFICFLIISIVYSLNLPEANANIKEPFFRIIRLTHIGNSTTNFDSVFLILYCISAYIYLSTLLSYTIEILNLTFNKKISLYCRYVILAIIIVSSLNSFLGDYIFELFSKNTAILFVTTFILPQLFLLMDKVKKCRLKN